MCLAELMELSIGMHDFAGSKKAFAHRLSTRDKHLPKTPSKRVLGRRRRGSWFSERLLNSTASPLTAFAAAKAAWMLRP